LAIVVLVLVALFGLGIWILGDRVAAQFGEIAQRLPEAWKNLREWLVKSQAGRYVLESLAVSFDGVNAPPGRIASLASTTLGVIADVGIVFVLGLFLAAEPRLYRNGVVKLVPPRGRARAEEALDAVGTALERWL